MAKPVFISKSQELPKSMDFRFLFEEAIHYAQQFSGDIWTDYNEHDPGVTLLEYLCYAITDLGYRTNFPIEDLLYARTNPLTKSIANALFPREDILCSAPLTINDYRKLLIDHEQVNNAWVVPLQNSTYRGLYEIKLQLLPEDENDPHHYRLLRELREKLVGQRNLSEDFAKISVLRYQYFSIAGDIILKPDALAESVMAQLLLALNYYLIPRIKFASQASRRAEGLSTTDFFDGPLIEHGFLADEDLQHLPAVVYVSEIKDLLLTIDGVQSIGPLSAMIDGISVRADEIEIPKDTYFLLDPKMLTGTSRKMLELHRNGFTVPVNYRQVHQIYQRLLSRKDQQYHPEISHDALPPKSKKRLVDISAYHSLQRFLPAIYGLGAYGLPGEANNLRKAQARQLKAYLLIPELLLSSYLAQLAQLKNFFSVAEEQLEAPSYYYQFPFDIPDVQPLIRNLLGEKTPENINQQFNESVKSLDNSGERRNRFLDHLLARFGERFDQSVFQRIAIIRDWNTQMANQRLLQAKAHYLREITTLSKTRACGYNYLQLSWGQTGEKANICGLKDRLYHQLYLQEPADIALTKLPTFSGFKARPTTPKKATISLSLRQLLNHGQTTANYHIHESDAAQYELYFHPSLQEEPQLVAAQPTFAAAKKQRDDLIAALKEVEENSLGFFVLEHILLRPQRSLGRKMTVEINEAKVSFTFTSFHYQQPEKVTHSSNNFLITATNPANLEAIEIFLEGEKFGVLIIKEDGYPILRSQLFPGGSAAIPTKPLLALLNKKKKQGSSSINNWISFESEPDYGPAIGGDFFSQRISLIVPNWPKAFQNRAFRQIFEKLLAENIPAHLSAKIHWFGLSKMRDFEEKYKKWLTAKEREEDLLLLDNCSQDLIRCICEDHLKEKIDPTTEDHQQTAALKQALFDQLGYAFLFQGTELQIIEGIGSKINHLLLTYGIDTWKELAHIQKARLEKILEINGLRLLIPKADSWIEQARLAVKGQWSALIELQQRLHATTSGDGTSPAKVQVYSRQHFNIELGT